MRPAARILLLEAAALRPIIESTPQDALDLPTVCAGWSVRDVLGHCGAVLHDAAAGTRREFTPEENRRDVDERRRWPLQDVLAELFSGYQAAAEAIDRAGGTLDGVGLGEWIHGGDVRDAVGAPGAYVSAGIALAVPLLIERSRFCGAPRVDVTIDEVAYTFGSGERVGALATDVETFVRLCSGRRPDPARYSLGGASPADLVLFG
jgi:uncharacterized protein (TIGR03083 family)